MTDFLDVDATLEDWSALRATTDFNGLLVGNGASRAVWDDFGYDSLFENARTVEEKPLSPSELSVFDAMQTRSFEQVLGALKTTSRVNKALAVSSAAPRNRYYAIKEALINTVHAVHIPWRLVQASTLATLNEELARYRTVFTTNYDLLNHWAIQHRSEVIDDLFNGPDASFDLSASASTKPRLLYLHGGLHLVRNQDGTARKLTSTEGTLQLLHTRQQFKHEVRAQVTVIAAQANNPLKFSPTVEVALAHLLGPGMRGFMPAEAAMRDAYQDLRAHEFGVMVGMRAALAHVIEQFAPEALEQNIAAKSRLDAIFSANRKAKLWDQFVKLYADIAREAEDDFHALFGKAFLKAYEEQLDRLQRDGKKQD